MNFLYLNDGQGRFEEVGLLAGAAYNEDGEVEAGMGVDMGDFDNDGDLDILVANCADVPTLMRNEGGNRNNWLQVLLQGVQSNRNALGARVELVSGDLRLVDQVRSGASYLSQSDMRLFFGLGTRRRVDRLEVLWPSGLVEAVEDLRVNQEITLTEGQQ